MQSRRRLRVQDDMNENSTPHPIALGIARSAIDDLFAAF